MANMIDSMARGPEGMSLVGFMRQNGLSLDNSDDWTEPSISAVLSGNKLDNIHGTAVLTDDGDISDEYLVHLSGKRAKCVFNLSVLLAMATAYCADRQAMAAATIGANGRRQSKPKKVTRKKTKTKK